MFVRRYERIRADIDRLNPTGGVVGKPELRSPLLPDFTLYDRIEDPRQWTNLGRLVTRSADFFYVATGERDRGQDRRLRLSVAYSDSETKARDALAWMLAQTQARVELVARDGLAFATLRNSAVYMIRGNALTRAVNVGRNKLQLASLVPVLDENLQRLGRPGPDPVPHGVTEKRREAIRQRPRRS